MPHEETAGSPRRRELLRMIGLAAGGAAMYQAMSALGFAQGTRVNGELGLAEAPRGASVLILGAGLAGMTAAYELRHAGYAAQVLEYNDRPGGRNWSLRGGDRYTELGGATQYCRFDPGLYFNPGPWRIPYHHRHLLGYCKRLGVPLEPFIQINYNSYLHSRTAFGGRPQRYRCIDAEYRGMVAELLAKAINQQALDAPLTREDREKLLESLRSTGALDAACRYVRGDTSSSARGFEKDPGGGSSGKPIPSQPIGPHELLDSGVWQSPHEGATTVSARPHTCARAHRPRPVLRQDYEHHCQRYEHSRPGRRDTRRRPARACERRPDLSTYLPSVSYGRRRGGCRGGPHPCSRARSAADFR